MTASAAERLQADSSQVPRKEKPARDTESEKQRWIEENREAFRAYDAMVGKFGLFGDEHRLF